MRATSKRVCIRAFEGTRLSHFEIRIEGTGLVDGRVGLLLAIEQEAAAATTAAVVEMGIFGVVAALEPDG